MVSNSKLLTSTLRVKCFVDSVERPCTVLQYSHGHRAATRELLCILVYASTSSSLHVNVGNTTR